MSFTGTPNVDPVSERLLQLRNVGDMREKPQLDLRIVGADQHMARRGDEGLADLASRLVAHRNILKVWLG
jgi:hypothetical protein